jgi:hypothetical protein
MNKRRGGLGSGLDALLPSAAPIGGAHEVAISTIQQNPRQPAASQVRSPEYARVLDRYVARLVAMKRVPDALALYRREIDRNVDDPGLYDVLAAFLEQNRLGAETEQVYQQAISHFQENSWSQKLARWYLRQRRQADVERRDHLRVLFRIPVGQFGC